MGAIRNARGGSPRDRGDGDGAARDRRVSIADRAKAWYGGPVSPACQLRAPALEAIAAALTGRWRFGLVLGGSLGALYRPWQDTSQLSPNTERIRSTPASRAL